MQIDQPRGRIEKFLASSLPLMGTCRRMIRRLGLGTFGFRLRIGALERPHYAYILLNAARLAKRLNQHRISAIEFGVAGGNGLVILENYAEQIEASEGVRVEIFGFDTGTGLPPPESYRDLPYHWKAGFFAMDQKALLARLKKSKIVFGRVEDTAASFFEKFDPAPVGAVIHDFDYYSSTAAALQMFLGNAEKFLPRTFCYFDDTIGSDIELYSEFTGQRLAINEFNRSNENRKIAQPSHLAISTKAYWHHQIWVFHLFDHANYGTFVSEENQQLKLLAS